MSKRLFLAIQLADDVRQLLYDYRRSVSISGARWTEKQNLHVTVHFLGDVPNSMVDALIISLTNVIQKMPVFSVIFKQITFAPPHGPGRMVWAEYQRDSSFEKMVFEIKKATKPFIVGQLADNDKQPIPHVTMARLTQPILRPFVLEQHDVDPLVVRFIDLVESQLQQSGPIYSILETIALKAPEK